LERKSASPAEDGAKQYNQVTTAFALCLRQRIPRVHFGLGRPRKIDPRDRYQVAQPHPPGFLHNVAADRILTIGRNRPIDGRPVASIL